MAQRVDSVERLVANRIAAYPEVRRIILFGSRARGDHRVRSDIDLAVEADTIAPGRWFEILEAAEETPTLLKIDLVRLDEAPPELAEQIRREGRTVYERT